MLLLGKRKTPKLENYAQINPQNYEKGIQNQL
jgi:hypothetical protein